jgi:hypothetical protein
MRPILSFLGWFFLLGMFCIPFSWSVLSFWTKLIETISIPYVRLFFPLTDVSSDSKGFVFWMATILCMALVLSVIFRKQSGLSERVIRISTQIGYVYLSVILLKYGFDKVFKKQFYLPEPNLLYTPMGRLDHDILFWSSMGSSYLFNLLTGGLEVLAGILIYFQKWRKIGLLMALIIFIQILIVNISFDISVKCFVGFLLLLTLFCFREVLLPMWRLLTDAGSNHPRTISTPGRAKPNLYFAIFIPIFLLAESLLPHIISGNFHDDRAPRPKYHGAYEVVNCQTDIPEMQQIKRVFFHRNQYIIFQSHDDSMMDFSYGLTRDGICFQVSGSNDEPIQVQIKRASNGKMMLQSERFQLTVKELKWRKLPLMQPNFHWTVD